MDAGINPEKVGLSDHIFFSEWKVKKCPIPLKMLVTFLSLLVVLDTE
jgi:hypothetical protein